MRRMATLTQERRAHLQQAFSSRTVRVMAVGTIVIDRLVVMHEGAAFFHVAGVTGLIDAIALHEFRSNRTMRIMAIGTGHLAFRNRVMRRAIDL